MDIEYEATFLNVNKDNLRKKLKVIGATLVKSEFLQKRVVFFLPKGHEVKGGWVRVRDESDKITMSFKVVDGNTIQDQKETCLVVDNFQTAEQFLVGIGCVKKSYQENKREKWLLEGVEITIDEWPFLEPFTEIEGKSEEEVKKISEKLGFDYSKAVFGSLDVIVSRKYSISEDDINNHTPLIIFEGENPYLVHQKNKSSISA